LQRLYYTLERVLKAQRERPVQAARNEELDELERRFHEAMEDDFNTAVSLAAIFDLSKVINRMLDENAKSAHGLIEHGKNLLLSFASILGLLQDDLSKFSEGEAVRHLSRVGMEEAQVQQAIRDRAEARKDKDYERADQIRDMLLEKGITLLDSPDGTTWRVKR
jgi:cysteinyl-tRNA synthetase